MKTEFLKYIADIADERGLPWGYRLISGIIIRGKDDKAMEVVNEGTTVALYYFSSFTNDAIWYCNEMDLSDPESIPWIMEWLDRLEKD